MHPRCSVSTCASGRDASVLPDPMPDAEGSSLASGMTDDPWPAWPPDERAEDVRHAEESRRASPVAEEESVAPREESRRAEESPVAPRSPVAREAESKLARRWPARPVTGPTLTPARAARRSRQAWPRVGRTAARAAKGRPSNPRRNATTARRRGRLGLVRTPSGSRRSRSPSRAGPPWCRPPRSPRPRQAGSALLSRARRGTSRDDDGGDY